MILDSGSEQPTYLTSRYQVYVQLLQDPASNYSNQACPSKFYDYIRVWIMMAAVGWQTQFGNLSLQYFENSHRVCSSLKRL